MVHYPIHNSPILVPIGRQFHPVHAFRTNFRHILVLPSRLASCSKRSLSSKSPHLTLYAPLLYPIRATCPAHLILHSKHCKHSFVLYHFLRLGAFSNPPNPQARRPPPVGSHRHVLQNIRSCPPYWRPFLQPQPEDVPCRGINSM